MSLNFLGAHAFGGGPAHLLANPAPEWCALLALWNGLTAAAATGSLVYGSFAKAEFGGSVEVLQYLVLVGLQGVWCASWWGRLAKWRRASDEEWSRQILLFVAAAAVQFGAIGWGVWLCYRMGVASQLPGTRMYYSTFAARWLYNAVLCVSALNAGAVALGAYLILVRLLVHLFIQKAHKKFAF